MPMGRCAGLGWECTSKSGVHKKLGGYTAGTADPN